MNGERIRTARQLLGVSQKELAEAIGVSKQQISAVESGTRLATDDLVNKIAMVTDIPLSFFSALQPDLPQSTLRFRKLSGAKRGTTKQTLALMQESYRVVHELLTDARYPTPNLPIIRDTPSHTDIERLAEETRYALGLDIDAPIRHVTRACERSGIAVVPLTLPGEDANEGEAIGHFGVSYWPLGSEPALIGYFPGGQGDRQRFTLAHELGHLVLHSQRRVIQDAEGEANRFAGAFLVPIERANEALGEAPLTLRDFQYMKAHWGVSIQALIMRGAQLGLIDPPRKVSLFKQLSARGWRKLEPVSVRNEEPVLVWKLLAARFGTSSVYQRASEPLGIGPLILRSLAPQPTT